MTLSPDRARSEELYFAYGSNLSPPRLRSRLPGAQVLGVAELAGHRLAFHKAGSDGSGKCDIPECSESRVLGLTYRIDRDDLATLDRIEGVGVGYRRERLDVRFGERAISVHSYIASRIDPGLRPFSWYLQHVLVGACTARLPASYQSRIQAVDAVRDPDPDRERRELAIYSDSWVEGKV